MQGVIKLLEELEVIKEDEQKRISIISDNGKKYIQKRIYDDKREVYKILQKINHPNIPEIICVEFDGDTVVTEEYIEGENLGAIIECHKPLSKKDVKTIAKQLASAMEELHNAKIIHRDIKPDNIIIDDNGRLCLIDYDIARVFRDDLRRDTELKGTFGYAPIEQYGMMPTDFKTDIYAFGITLKKLLEYTNVKSGALNRIANKCAKLDPSERYSDADAIQKALKPHYIKYIAFCAAAVIVAFTVLLFVKPNVTEEETAIDVNQKTADENPEEIPAESREETDFDGDIYGFEYSEKEEEYSNYSAFSDVTVFRMDQPYEHILFLEDETKTGKVKLGTDKSIINAVITLKDGILSVSLEDENGNKFSENFSYNDYNYERRFTEELRKNADIICYDLDADGGKELLIGLNEGYFKAEDKYVYNIFNYCAAWCVKYDAKGFTLCDGEMLSIGYSFTINSRAKRVNVYWDNFGDPTGYVLNDYKIETVY